MSDPIVIVGAGLSGLAAALELEAAGESALIIERSAHIGGKLETSVVEDAYLLDRGFQVLLPAYPELKKFANLGSELDLQYFNSGARLEMADGPILMAHPLHHPSHLLATAFGAYATPHDKILAMKLQIDVQQGDPESLLSSAKGTTLEYLRSYGFSEKMIAAFWAPFFSGIFLETDLTTSAGYFRYLTRMFASSPVAVPKLGIGELPKWLARKLKRSEMRLSTEVRNINQNTVELSNGQRIKARVVITMTKGDTNIGNPGPFGWVASFWFKAAEAPFEGKWISLNSRPQAKGQLINHVAVLSNVNPNYAPKGDALVCVNVVGRREKIKLESLIAEATDLYGQSAKSWTLLRVDEIEKPFALYVNRTDSDTPSQQGALARGRKAARQTLDAL
jgi:hypothetical protein